MLLSARGEPREQAQTAGPWIVLNAGPCTDYKKSGLPRGLHKKKIGHRGLLKQIRQGATVEAITAYGNSNQLFNSLGQKRP